MLSGNIKKDIGTRIKKARTGENDNSSENTLDHIIELSQNLSAEEIGSLVDYYSALVNLRRLSEKKKSSADASAKSVKSNNTASHDNLKQCACQE